MALTPGVRLGVYEVIALVGAGGMGEVYRARDTRLGRDVALKVLPDAFTADPDRRDRFEREARVLASLSHPHIGGIYGLEEAGGVTALVLEFVEGETLAMRLRRGTLPMAEALSVARQIAGALDAAHQRQIVHRDLKPANIVLQRATSSAGTPSVKVLDFGLATTVNDGVNVEERSTELRTEAGRILGTPAYMSPEQARGLPVDKRTDIWAFGCVVFEMLSGHRPFGGDSATDMVARILEREPDWTLLPPETPVPLRILLGRCLRKDSVTRLRDIADARLELDDLDSPASSWREQPRRPHWGWVAASVAVLSIVALVVLLALSRLSEQAPAVEALEFPVAPPDAGRFASHYGGFRLSPDGKNLVVTVISDNRPSLWVRPIGVPEYRQITGTDHALFPFWKPDSSAIGFFAGGKLKTVPLGGGVPTIVCDAPASARWEGAGYDEVGATWSRDDTIVFMSEAFTLQKVPARGGAPVAVTSLGAGEIAHRWPAFLPDGRHFLYLALTGTGAAGALRVASLDGGPPVPLGAFESSVVYADGHLLFLSGGQLVAQPFDPETRRTSAAPRAVARTTTFSTWNHLGAFTASQTGVIAYHPGGPIPVDQRLAWRDRAGRAGDAFGEVGRYTSFDLSPDDTRVAVSLKKTGKATDIWVIQPARGDGVPLTSDPAWEFDPSWSPDGARIVFNSSRLEGRPSLFSRASNGSGEDTLVLSARAGAETPVWRPDGRAVVYADGGDLWTYSIGEAQKPSLLWQTPTREMAPALSPNGRWLAYISDKSGRPELYIRAFPDGEDERKVSIDGAMAPRWRGDGREIYFLTLDAVMMAASVDSDSGVPGPIEMLFPTSLSFASLRPYAVTRNGERFLMPVAIEREPPITAVINWQARLPK
jgi:Tol biopolymer transport system component